jgi:hypothetical protein
MKEYKVYFVEQESRGKDKPVKIGVSCNVESRLSKLQTGNPYKLSVKAVFPCKDQDEAFMIERTLHWLTKKKYRHIRGEWFYIYGSWAKLIKEAMILCYGKE